MHSGFSLLIMIVLKNNLCNSKAEINHYLEEFKTGNEAYSKLQEERNKMSAQLKVKSKILQGQEKKMEEKEKECEQMRNEMQKLKKELSELKEEKDNTNSLLKQKTSELEEAVKKISKQEGCEKISKKIKKKLILFSNW